MADNALTVLTADGNTATLRSRDVGSGTQQQGIDAAPARPTALGSAQYALNVTGSTAVTLTLASGATHVFLTVEDGDVRMTENTDTPTTGAGGNGMLLPAGFIGELPIPLSGALKFIAVSTTAQINASYRKYV